MRKKLLSLFVCAAMALSLVPMSAFADGREAVCAVTMGNVTLENGIYIPNSESVVEKTDEAPQDGNYIEYSDGTITVYGNVGFADAGVGSPLTVESGTVTITGQEGSKLILTSSTQSAVTMSQSTSGILLDGAVDFTAEQKSELEIPAIINHNECSFTTSDGYSGDISLSSNGAAISGGNGRVNLKTSGNIEMSETQGGSPLISGNSLSLEAKDIKLSAEKAMPIIVTSGGNISLASQEGDLVFYTNPQTVNNSPIIYANGSEVFLSAPEGNISFTSSSESKGLAVSARKTTVESAKSFKVSGGFAVGISGEFATENCPVIDIAAANQSVSGSVNISGGSNEKTGSAKFNASGNAPCITSGAVIKNYKTVEIYSPPMAVVGDATIENCGTVKIGSKSPAPTIVGTAAITNCDDVTIENNGGGDIASNLNHDNKGKLTTTKKGTTTVKQDGETVSVTENVKYRGLRFYSGNTPTEETTYIAGNGTIIFTPAKEGKNAKLVMNNAEIEIDSFAAIDSRNNENLDIEINGKNTLCGSCGIRSAGSLNMYGSGTLTVDAKSETLSSERNIEINGGKFILSGESGISAQKNMTVNGGNISITASGSGDGIYVNEGDITINDGTLNINSESTNVYGILSSNDVNEEVGNIYIHGGTVNINVVRHAMFSDRNIVIDGNAVVNAVGNDGGIYLSKGNLEISGNAKVNAIDGIRAVDGNIIISGNANLTAESYGYEGIYIKGTLEIRDNAVVSADGAGKNYDIVAEGGLAVSDGAKLNAFVQTGEEVAAYGICDSNDIASVKVTSSNKLHVAEGAKFTVTPGTSMEISDYANTKINGKVINKGTTIMTVSDVNEVPKGKIENNGQFGIDLSKVSADAQKVVGSMGLTGTGVVSVQTAESGFIVYSNDGTKLKNVPYVDISGDASKGNLDTDGYYWDKDTNTLTLKDIMVSEIKGKINDDVTIKTEGYVNISEIQDITGGALTLTGDTLKISDTISVEGNLVIENKIADIGSISNGNGNSRLTFLNTTSTVNSINWTDNGVYKGASRYGVVLTNSNVTVGGVTYSQFFAGKIDMDDNSVLTLNKTAITNYGNYPNGLDGLKPYLPKNGGYKIDVYVSEMTDKPYTILDADGNIVDTIVLKKQSSGGSTGGNTGGGSSGGGSSEKYYKITVKSAENGKVELSRAAVLKDNVVTVTATADEGYELGKITVLNDKNEAVALTDKGGKYEFKMPAGDVTVEALFVKKAAEEKIEEEKTQSKAFSDVMRNAWYKDAVDYASAKGLMSGISDSEFGPALLTNRAMLVSILWRMEGSPVTNYASGFTDINGNDYYYNAVLWAAENKIVSGVSKRSFDPAGNITREQLAAILYRYAVYKGYDVSQGGMAIREFADYEEISEYALTSLAWAVNAGIVSGKGNNTLDPKGGATRAEAASMLMRFCENIVK